MRLVELLLYKYTAHILEPNPMQTANAKPYKQFQWLWVLTLAFVLAGWLGHQSPRYAAEEGGGIFEGISATTGTSAPYPLSSRSTAQQKAPHAAHRLSAHAL